MNETKHRCYLVWGDLNSPDGNEKSAFLSDFGGEEVDMYLSFEGTYAQIKFGPSVVEGTVVSNNYDTDIVETVVYVSRSIPEWVNQGLPEVWGWYRAEDFPTPQRYPFSVDVLLLSEVAGNPNGKFDGWSSSLWFDNGVRPLQRLPLTIDERTGDWIMVRVLDCGVNDRGTGYAVVYVPDREAVQRVHLERHGWWREPWIQVRAPEWRNLATISDAVETRVLTVLRNPIVADVRIKSLLGIPDEALPLLPRDVRDGLERALKDLPDD